METEPTGTLHRQQLFHCLVALLFLLSVAVLRAEERNVWSNHLAELNQRVPAGFVIVVQPQFVVAGDEAPRMVWSRFSRLARRLLETIWRELGTDIAARMSLPMPLN